MQNLSPRIEKLWQLAGHCRCLGDVGTDHGFVPVRMVENGLVECAIASDINKGPLERARVHVDEAGLADKIQLRLGSGMTVYKPGECDVFIVAGMGGLLIADILQASRDVAESAGRLILQPNTCIPDLRKYLWDNGFTILDEDTLAEKEHTYIFLTVKYTGEIRTSYSQLDLEMGDILQGKPDGKIYYKALHTKTTRKLAGLKKAANVNQEEIRAAEKLIEALEEHL
ncbi:MAG: SAM-dependent methyltransferase [Ruminococcaceae bacterium]|nr:SAM-dependent methyltransferase [Oscillospiraceae bacterium]